MVVAVLAGSVATFLVLALGGEWLPLWARSAKRVAPVLPAIPPLVVAAFVATWGPERHRRSVLLGMALASVGQWAWAFLAALAFVDYLRQWGSR